MPDAPDWRLDWDSLKQTFPWVRQLHDCPQDPVHHSEGDVGEHTRLVCQALVRLDQWQSLQVDDRFVVFAAALLHDIAKLETTRKDDDGRITSRGHAARGEVMARGLLWRMDVLLTLRESIARLVRHHARPLHVYDREDSERLVIEISVGVRCDWLSLLARADVLGRRCAGHGDLLDRVDYFDAICQELDCVDRSFPFASDYSRVEFFRRPLRDPRHHAYDDTWGEVVVMSGLPASGKDTFIAREFGDRLPIISLDAIRQELKISPAGPQDAVVALARERARELLRDRTPFVWNGTNLSRDMRRRVLSLIHNYGARVHIAYVEASEAELYRRNGNRAWPVPADKIEDMVTRRWQVPDLTEAQAVTWTVT